MLIKSGSKGHKVKAIQTRLQELGYESGEADGIFGDLTETAVRAFQADQGLLTDGKVGPKTWAVLFGGEAAPVMPEPTREYINQVMYGGQEVYDILDDLIAAVSAGEGGFDTMNLNVDGEGLSFGYIQWAQNPGSLYDLLAAFDEQNHAKFVEILGGGDEDEAAELLSKTEGGGKELPLWTGKWVERFREAGQDVEFQRVQRALARKMAMAKLQDGYQRYPEEYKPEGQIALQALVMMADVGNQSGPGGLRKAIAYAKDQEAADEETFIQFLGEYVENIIAAKYGDPNYGDTQGRHNRIRQTYSMERLDWPHLAQTVLV
jgi:hypothetical protein